MPVLGSRLARAACGSTLRHFAWVRRVLRQEPPRQVCPSGLRLASVSEILPRTLATPVDVVLGHNGSTFTGGRVLRSPPLAFPPTVYRGTRKFSLRPRSRLSRCPGRLARHLLRCCGKRSCGRAPPSIRAFKDGKRGTARFHRQSPSPRRQIVTLGREVPLR